MQQAAHRMRLPFTNDQSFTVSKSQEPSLAAHRIELTHVVHIHQRISMHPLKRCVLQLTLNDMQWLRGGEAILGGDNPYNFSIGLKCEYFLEVQQYVFVAAPADDLADP